jgi:hypothetical protein
MKAFHHGLIAREILNLELIASPFGCITTRLHHQGITAASD